jgi:hypothetical protein
MITYLEDTYLTLAEANVLLAGNEQWLSIKETYDNKEKLPEDENPLETLLKNATKMIDIHLNLLGKKVDDSQLLEFPRNFGRSDFPVFSENEQKRRLKIAVFHQIESILSKKAYGVVSVGNAVAAPAQPMTGISIAAKSILQFYINTQIEVFGYDAYTQ